MQVKTLKLYCLGGLTFVQDSLILDDLKLRKGQALLCYLAVNRKIHHRSTLAGLLWPDMPEANALMNLRKTLNRLKPFLPYLTITRETLALNQSIPFWLDVMEFESASANRADIRQLQYAVSLYQGDFLDEFQSDDIPLFDEWVMNQRERLREIVLALQRLLVAYFTNQHLYPEAITHLRQLLKIEPWHEEAQRTLMRLLALSGQRSTAIKQYEICQRVLDEELAVKPAVETTLLYQQIVAGDLEQIQAGGEAALQLYSLDFSQSLPAQETPLVGRLNELAELRTYLAEPFIRLISIIGPGGMGKTHLALSLAHKIAAEDLHFEGVIFVPLRGITTRQRLLIALASQLNLDLAGSRDPEKRLFDQLHSKQILIVLDNFEQLLPEVDFLIRLLEAVPRSKLLVTSRERLKLHQEWVLDLPGLPYPENEQYIQSSTPDAVTLFAQRAQALQHDFSIENNYKAITRICQSVQGMPLALEMAASWIRVLSAEEIANQITQNLSALSSEMHSVRVQHHTMQAVFDSSWQLLSTEEQSVMSSLAVFTGGFTLAAAREVTGASVSTLSTLVDKSFLNRDPRLPMVTRYQIHELIRQYAQDRLQAAGQLEQAKAHHQAYFLALAEEAGQYWDTEQENKWLQRLDAERGNLYAALQHALDQEHVEVLLRFNAALFSFWTYKSPSTEASEWLECTLALPWDQHNLEVLRYRAKVLNAAGYTAVIRGSFEQARACFEEAVAIYERIQESRGLTWSLRGCGFVALFRGDFDLAQSLVKRSLAICEETQDEWGIAWSLYDLGYSHLENGKMGEARELLERALAQFRLLNIRFGEFRALIALGYYFYFQNHMLQAVVCYQQALLCQQHSAFYTQIADIFEGLAYVAAADGKNRFAVKLLGAAQKHREVIGFLRLMTFNHEYHRNLELLQARLGEKDFRTIWDQGASMNHQQAARYALAEATSTIPLADSIQLSRITE